MSSQSPSSNRGTVEGASAPETAASKVGRCAVNAILIGADRGISTHVFSGFALPWRTEPIEVHRADDPEAACSWLRAVVEPGEGNGLRFPCGLMHLWRSDLFQQHVTLLGSCQVSVVVVNVDKSGISAGSRLLEELRAIRPDGEVLVAAVHEGGVLVPEPADIVELLGELGSELRLDVVTVQHGSRLDNHRLAHSLRLAARRSLARGWQPPSALDWSATPPRTEWFTAGSEPEPVATAIGVVSPAEALVEPGPRAPMVTTPPNTPASAAAERRRKRNVGGGDGLGGSGFRRATVLEDVPPVPDYNPPNVSADMAASIAAAIQSSSDPEPSGADSHAEPVDGPELRAPATGDTPRKRGLLRSALGI